MMALSVPVLAGVISAPTALATPLNLAYGDFVNSVAFDALYQTRSPLGGPPNGSTYDAATLGINVDTRITSVNVDPGSITKDLVVPIGFGVTFRLDARLSSHITIPLGAPLIFVNATFVSKGGPIDWSMEQAQGGLGTLVNGTFNTPLVLAGLVNVNSGKFTVNQLLSGANLAITNGDTDLIAALHGTMRFQPQTVFNFAPGVNALGGDLNLFNDNFTFALSGTIHHRFPTSWPVDGRVPYVPETGTGALLGFGLLGALALARRGYGRQT